VSRGFLAFGFLPRRLDTSRLLPRRLDTSDLLAFSFLPHRIDTNRILPLRFQLGCRVSRGFLAFDLLPRHLDTSRLFASGLLPRRLDTSRFLPLRLQLGCRVSRGFLAFGLLPCSLDTSGFLAFDLLPCRLLRRNLLPGSRLPSRLALRRIGLGKFNGSLPRLRVDSLLRNIAGSSSRQRDGLRAGSAWCCRDDRRLRRWRGGHDQRHPVGRLDVGDDRLGYLSGRRVIGPIGARWRFRRVRTGRGVSL
jgi:hypothetical protein